MKKKKKSKVPSTKFFLFFEMIEISNKPIVVGLVWALGGSLINKYVGVETLQLYLILSLAALFIHFGTSNRKRRPGEESSYAFLTANKEDLENEVVPFVADERMKQVLLRVFGHVLPDDIPSESTVAGGELRRMIARQATTADAVAVLRKLMDRENAVVAPRDYCPCGSKIKFWKCCSHLAEHFIPEEEKKPKKQVEAEDVEKPVAKSEEAADKLQEKEEQKNDEEAEEVTVKKRKRVAKKRVDDDDDDDE